MTTTYIPLKYAKKAMREVREESLREGERRGYARATEFVRMASTLNGSTHAVLKALQDESPHNRMAEVGRDDGPDLDAVMMAALDALAEAKTHHPETDGGPVYAYLAGLLDDPEALKEALAEMDGGEVVGKSFDESKHPRGDNGRFIGREQIHAAKSDPKLAEELRAKTTDPTERKKLDAALAGEVDTGRTKAGEHRERVAKQRQDRAERVKRAQELANEISMWRRGGEAVPSSHFRELAEVLPSMTVAELRSVRGKLAASFGGDRRKAEMAARLLDHAKNKAALLETNEKYDDMDALDFGSLHEYQNEGNAKGNESRNPNPEEQHGGRMEQRHQLMANLPESDKTARGTPDVGSVLKQGAGNQEADRKKGQPEPSAPAEPAEPPAQKLTEKKTRKPSSTDTLFSWVQHYGGIDPESHAFQTFFSSVTEARENGIPLGVFKTGGEGLDVIARQMLNSGHINAADEVEAQQVLLDGLASKAYSYHADRTKDYDKALQDYERAKQEAADALDESSIREAERSGEAEADRGEPASGRGEDQDHDAGDGRGESSDAAEPTGEVDTSFDFGELEAPTSQAAPPPAAQPSPEITPEQAAARKWKKNDDGTYTAPNGVVWKKAATGGEVSPITGQPFKGGHLMPIHGKSQGGLETEGTGGEGSSKVGIGGKVDQKKKPDQTAKKPYEKKSRDIHGNLVPVPEGHRTLESIVAGSPMKSHMLSDETLANTLGLTRKQANDLKAIYESGAVSIPKEALPPSWQTRGHVPSDDWDISAKFKELSDPHANASAKPTASPVVSAAASAPTGWVGDDLLLINHAFRHLQATDPAYKGMTLDQFKADLIRENGKGVQLSRADLPQALDPNDVRESEAQHPAMKGRHGGEFHFIKTKRAEQPKTAAPSSIPPDHHTALRDALKHHKRMQMPGTPVPNHVVYTKPAVKDATGKPMDPEETVASSVDGETGKRLLAGKIPHYTVHGVYEFGADGTPRKVESGGQGSAATPVPSGVATPPAPSATPPASPPPPPAPPVAASPAPEEPEKPKSNPREMIASKLASATGGAQAALKVAAYYIEPHHDAAQAIKSLNYALRNAEEAKNTDGMAVLTDAIKELGGKPRPTLTELREKAKLVDQVSGQNNTRIEYDGGYVIYALVDPKSGNRVGHPIQSDTAEGIAKEIKQAKAEMKRRQQETASRIRGERSANNS